MPGFEMRWDSRLRGPISSGQIHRHVAEYEHDVAEELAEESERMILKRLGQVLRHPTGYYESRIDTRQLAANRYEIHDSDVVYGPWLEGTGSRNSPVTIFPGYHTFQTVEIAMKRKRGNIGRRVLRRHRSRGRLT